MRTSRARPIAASGRFRGRLLAADRSRRLGTSRRAPPTGRLRPRQRHALGTPTLRRSSTPRASSPRPTLLPALRAIRLARRVDAAVGGVGAAAAARVGRRPRVRPQADGNVLRHHGDRLRQRRPPPRPCTGKDRRRRHRAVSPDAWRPGAFPDRHGRTRPESRACRSSRRCHAPSIGGSGVGPLSSDMGTTRHLARPVHSDDGPRANRGGARADRADLRPEPRRLLRAVLHRLVLRGV